MPRPKAATINSSNALPVPQMLPVGRTMRAAARRPHEHGKGPGVIQPRELIEGLIIKGDGLSLPAHKLLILMIRFAGSAGWIDKWHEAAKKDLRGKHRGNDRFPRLLSELRSVQICIRRKSERGWATNWEGAVLSETEHEIADDGQALVRWRFSGPMRELLQMSQEYADLRVDVIMPLTSLYALRLYQLGALHVNRQHPVWRGAQDDLRAALHVPAGVYRDWADVRRKVLDVAKAEVDLLAPFTVDWRVSARSGKAVKEIEILFVRKDLAAHQATEVEIATRKSSTRNQLSRRRPRALDL